MPRVPTPLTTWRCAFSMLQVDNVLQKSILRWKTDSSQLSGRHLRFAKRIQKLGDLDEEFYKDSSSRYHKFLTLIKENPGQMLVPTLDIDLFWHSHILHPNEYRSYCFYTLGKILNHDDSVEDSKLTNSFARTVQLWVKITFLVWKDCVKLT